MPKPPNKNRSRRLRKKLHVGEFTEHGFEYEVELRDRPSLEDEIKLIDRFLEEVIESRCLALGGGLKFGFVSSGGNEPVTEVDRAIVEEWLRSNLPAKAVRVSELIDAWY